MPRLDLHQHIWTEPLLSRLAARRSPPMVRLGSQEAVLFVPGERPSVLDLSTETLDRRAAWVEHDGLDLALIALSSPLGIEALPRENALELIDAHLRGVACLPERFAAWGPVALDFVDEDDVDDLLARGCVGISLPAGALAGPDRLDRVGVILERTAARQVPLFVHPGPAPGTWRHDVSVGEPVWWPALTDYVSQMQAAWLTFAAFGRDQHPELTVVFAMLAGAAPLLSERLASRGGPAIELGDPGVFYETSSYGPSAVEMMASVVGDAQLVYGSDRPVVEPRTTGRDVSLQVRAASLLTGALVPA